MRRGAATLTSPPPFPPHRSTQLTAFLSVVAWLLGEAKRKFALDKLDDPSSSLARLMGELRALGAPAEVLDAPPLKLRGGAGEAACRILLFCADAALAARGFKFGRPAYPEEPPAGDAPEEEDDDGGADGADAPADAVASDLEAEDDVLYAPASPPRRAGGAGAPGGAPPPPPPAAALLAASVDPVAWRAEVERVAPRLRPPVPLGGGSTVPGGGGGLGGLGALGGALGGARGGGGGGGGARGGGGGEWRGHLEGTAAADATVSALLAPAFESLRRLAGDLADAAAHVSAREATLNTAFAPLVAEAAAGAAASAELSGAAAAAAARVTGLTSELAALGEALDEVGAAMDERGSSIADASPLIAVKAALAGVRADIRDLDVQLGVQGHAVMQARLLSRHRAQERAREARKA